MYGKREGCSRGRGGSMHVFDAQTRFYGGNAIVGGGLPLAVGLALADKLQQRPRVTACFFGDGAVAEGEFHESLNLAALWKLPVLFLCENNLYAMGTHIERAQSQTDLAAKARSYLMPAETVDGMDVPAVEAATKRAADAVRRGEGPAFLEFRTYRFRAHSMFDAELYRDKSEVEVWKQRDPIATFSAQLKEAGQATDAVLQALEDAVADGDCGRRGLCRSGHVGAGRGSDERRLHACRRSPTDRRRRDHAMITTYREAMRAAIREALSKDPRVFLMGEDVGRYGGAYAVSKGLLAEFGPERIRDTPLSESTFVGAGIGAALGGMRPIVEVMTVNFSLLALDQIVNNAATIRHMSGGQFSIPLVIRMATGAGRQLAAQHAHSLEGWYAHIPGIRIVAPATLEDARGMLWTALEDPDPVLIFEHQTLYNMEGPLADDAGAVDIDRAAVRRPGKDVSLITYGGTLGKTLQAAETLAARRHRRRGDRSAHPASARHGHGLRLGHEDAPGRHRRRRVAERQPLGGDQRAPGREPFYELDAPIARVCSAEVPIPYPKHLEDAALPQPPAIVAAARQTLGRRG